MGSKAATVAVHLPGYKQAYPLKSVRQHGMYVACLVNSVFLTRLIGTIEDMPPNPNAPDYVTGGVGAGCASAVAAGDVQFALGVDHLAGIRVSQPPWQTADVLRT